MKNFASVYFLFFVLVGCAPTQYANYTIRDKKTDVAERDTSHIYELPFEKGKRYLLVQGYNTAFSHKNEHSLDFKMKKGTKICAARSGTVVSLNEDSNIGGPRKKFMMDGNYISIKHNDGTYGGYWHLDFNGVLVEVGEKVEAGQVIGLSGNTGWSAFPHLHFWVYRYNDGFETIPTRFWTTDGLLYLKAGQFYLKQ